MDKEGGSFAHQRGSMIVGLSVATLITIASTAAISMLMFHSRRTLESSHKQNLISEKFTYQQVVHNLLSNVENVKLSLYFLDPVNNIIINPGLQDCLVMGVCPTTPQPFTLVTTDRKALIHALTSLGDVRCDSDLQVNSDSSASAYSNLNQCNLKYQLNWSKDPDSSNKAVRIAGTLYQKTSGEFQALSDFKINRTLFFRDDMTPYVWTGEAGDGLWTTAGNWSTNTVPGANQVAKFTGVCVGSACNANINTSISVGGIELREDYVGQLTQGNNQSIELTGPIGFTQKSGVFMGSNANISSPNIDIVGGSFSATSGTISVQQQLRVNSPGTFNHRSGSVHAYGVNGAYASVQMGSSTLNNLTTSCMVRFEGQIIQVEGNLTLNGGNNCYVTNGTLRVNGNINLVASTNPVGLGVASDVRVIAAGNPNGQSITGNPGSSVGILEIDAGTNPVTLVGTITVAGLFANGPKFPEFKITSVGNFTTTGSTLILTGGLQNSGTGSAQYFFGNKDLNSVVFSPGGSFDLNGQNLNVRGTLSIRGGYNQGLINGTIKAFGDLNFQASNSYGSIGSVNIIVAGNSAGQVIQSETGASAPLLEIDAGPNPVDLRGPLAISGSGNAQPGVYKYSSGSLTVDSSNILSCSNLQQGCRWTPGLVEYNDFEVTANPIFQRPNSLEGGTLRLRRDLKIKNNALFNNGTVEIGRNLEVQGDSYGSVNLIMKGIGTIQGAFRLPGSGLQIQSSGTVTLASNLMISGPGQDLLLKSGTLKQNNFSIQVADSLQIENLATLDMQSQNLSVTNSVVIDGTLIRGPNTSSCGSFTSGSTIVGVVGSISPAGCPN
ncbi:MAG: hypothetical protein WCH11_02605 [Bdellovibrio sp.]